MEKGLNTKSEDFSNAYCKGIINENLGNEVRCDILKGFHYNFCNMRTLRESFKSLKGFAIFKSCVRK